MAGAGYKLFNTGDVLTAAQVNTYLNEQTVMVFASSAARTSALSGVLAEGMMSYLQDTNSVQVYNGTSWVAVGGSSPLTTKGDLYGFSTVDARVPIGTNGHVLTADSTESLGLKWAAPAGGAFVGCSLSMSGAQSITNSTTTIVLFANEYFDTDSFHSTVTNTGRITVPSGKDGKYLLTYELQWQNNNGTGRRYGGITYYNSSNVAQFSRWTEVTPSGSTYPTMSGSAVINVVAGDYFVAEVTQNSGGSLDILGFINAVYLGA